MYTALQRQADSVRRHAAVCCVYVYTHTACAYTAVYTCVLEYTVRATCRVSWSNELSLIFRDLDKKGYRQGPGSGKFGKSLVKATISQRQYRYQNQMKITYKKTNFLCVYPLLVLRPDLDSSQDSRKVSQGIFQKNQKLAKL